MDGMTQDGLRERVLATVRRCIAESLAVPKDEILLESRLVDDLGADSLDFVDIVFMLDAELGIKVRETEFNFLTRLDFTSLRSCRRILEYLSRMEELAKEIPASAPFLSIDWSRTSVIQNALAVRLAHKVASELDGDTQLEQFANKATEAVFK